MHGRENVSSTKILVIDKKICSKHLLLTRFENFCVKTNKRRVWRKREGLGKFSKINWWGVTIRHLEIFLSYIIGMGLCS